MANKQIKPLTAVEAKKQNTLIQTSYQDDLARLLSDQLKIFTDGQADEQKVTDQVVKKAAEQAVKPSNTMPILVLLGGVVLAVLFFE